MILDRLLELDTRFYRECKPHSRCSNVEWLACMGIAYV